MSSVHAIFRYNFKQSPCRLSVAYEVSEPVEMICYRHVLRGRGGTAFPDSPASVASEALT